MSWLSFIPLIGPVIDGIVSTHNTKSTNDANIKQVKLANEANKELAKYNWQQQVAMWERNNEYNSPIQQMTRLKEAGLNPNLVYGNGVTGNSSSSIPTPQMPTMQAAHLERPQSGFLSQASQSAFSALMQEKNLKADLALKDSQKRATDAETLKRNQDVAESLMRTARGKFELDLAKDLRNNSVEAALLSTNQIKQKLAIGEEELKNFPIQRQLMNGQLALLEANRNLSVKEAEKKSYEIWKIVGEVANFAAQTRLTNAKADVESDPNYQQNLRAKLMGEALKAVATGKYEDLKYSYTKYYGLSESSAAKAAMEIADVARRKDGKYSPLYKSR